MEEIEKEYIQRFTNYYEWFSTSEKLLHSAKLFDLKIKELISSNRILEDDCAFEFASYRDSALLLTGLALENAIKGRIINLAQNEIEEIKTENLKVEKDDSFKTIEDLLNKKYKWNKSHNIKVMYEKNLNEMYSENREYFSRVQENLIWMGKYGLPNIGFLKNMKFSRDYWEDDVTKAENIINKLIRNLKI